MSVEITSSRRNGYIHIVSTGIVSSIEDAMALNTRYFEQVMRLKGTRVLIDESRVHQPQGLFQAMQIVEHMRDELPSVVKNWQVALVLHAGYREAGEFWETASVNMGFSNFRVFYDLEEAERWITAE